MLLLALFFLFFAYVFGGSPCPPRAEIYPCICIDRSIGKSKFDTTVICHGLANSDSLIAIEERLSNMDINRFLLYDSFWQATDSRILQTSMRTPVNHVSGFRVEELEVVDTILSVFGCPASDNCRTAYVIKYTAFNSTVPERSSCNNNGITVTSWVSCPGNVQQLTINKAFTSDMSLKPDFFPEPMSKLKTLNMSHNQISRIDKRTFNNGKFPVLHTLDLSHNSLRDAKYIFSSPLKVQYLDLSHNVIRSLVDFQQLPLLHTLKLTDNHLMALLENEWQQIPSSLRHIDLSNNNIQCTCALKWVNSTFHINTVLLGSCSSPRELVNKKLRRASRFFIERCDEDGNLGPKKSKKS